MRGGGGGEEETGTERSESEERFPSDSEMLVSSRCSVRVRTKEGFLLRTRRSGCLFWRRGGDPPVRERRVVARLR